MSAATRADVATFLALRLRLHRALEGRLQGELSGLRLGPGSELEEVTRYRPGEDDVRRMDWNVTARSLEPHVWRTRSDHELHTWVLVDESASMAFGTAELEKADLARAATAAIGLLTDGPGNRVGVAHLRTDGLTWDRPVPGRHAAHRSMRAGAGEIETIAGHLARPPLSLAEGLRQLDVHHRQPGLRVVISDFVEPDGATTRPFTWETALRRLSRRRETVVIEVVDPRELELPDIGPVVFLDPESGHRREVWTSLRSVRKRYAEAATEHRREVAAAVRSAGAGHVTLRTDRDWVADLAGFVLRRRRTPTRRKGYP